MHLVDKPVDDSRKTQPVLPVSPYLLRPLRSLDQVLSSQEDQRVAERSRHTTLSGEQKTP